MIHPERRRGNLKKIEEMDKIDREKVIKGLEAINDYFFDIYRNDTDSYKCEKAQEYSDVAIDALALLKEQEAAYQGAVELLRQKTILFDDAIKRLKEQEAVEPRVSSAEQRCGNCNKVIEMDGWTACPWCGKPIDWEGWWKKNGTRNQDT